ncbi:MAG: prephenate dehydrogenase [Anaerolineales bacterium]|nr:MAG: prephenate dehydrogenase [Anaerolineales bacterium]
MANEILLIGLSQVGTSLGLALENSQGEVIRVGYDPDKKNNTAAKAAGAVDRIVSHPRLAVSSADLIIFALPHHEVEDYLEHLGPKMKSDAIVIDTAPVKAPFFKWAAQYLPASHHVVGATPIMGALDREDTSTDATADRFAGGLVAITTSPDTSERALAAAINLAKVLDAEPFFLDIDELDAATAAIEDLPTLMSAAMFQLTANSPSWRELQRIAGAIFVQATEPCTTESKLLQQRIIANRQNIISRLDLMVDEIKSLRELLANHEDEDIIRYFDQADSTRYAWLRARARGDWASEELQSLPRIEKVGLVGPLFGLPRRKPKPD